MGKLYLHGRGNKSTKAESRAKLTVTCPAGLTVYAKSVKSSLTFATVADEDGKAVFDRLIEGPWDITVVGVDNPPTERIYIDELECDVSFPYTTVYVTYPKGSICNCVKDDTVLTAPDRSGSCSFDIYELGDWTVSSTNGVESDTEIVTVTTFDDPKNVHLLHDIYIIDHTGQRQVIDPVEFWGNDDENVEMIVNDDGSVSFRFLTKEAAVVSNAALDLTPYMYVYISSVLDREGVIKMSVLHPMSSAIMSGVWTVDNDTTMSSLKCNMAEQRGNRLIQVGSYDTANTTLTIHSLSLRELFSTISVTYTPGSTCTCSKGDIVLTAPDTSGNCTFNVHELGEWNVATTVGAVSNTDTVLVKSFGEYYNVELLIPTSTINVTYPPGSTCTCTNGVTVLTTSDASGSCIFNVYELGEWRVIVTAGAETSTDAILVESFGEYYNVDMSTSIINVTYPPGLTCTCTKGDTVLTTSDTSGSCVFTVLGIGDWTVSCTDGYNTISEVMSVAEGGTVWYVDLNDAFTEHNISSLIANRSELAYVCLPSELTSIGDYAFHNCINLALTSLPEGITSIGSYAFYACANLALTSLPEGITSIGFRAFHNCTNLALTSLPEGITSIADYAFHNCTNLALTSLPEGITSIGSYAFYNCTNLALTSLPEGITSIGSLTFTMCKNLALTSLPEGVTSIGSFAFEGCTNITLTSLPEGITSIGSYAFHNCKNLALTSLPEGITRIDSFAFQECTNLTTLTFKGTPDSIDSHAFYICNNLTTINVPWAEGAVANAPWGATKATINYNYKGA